MGKSQFSSSYCQKLLSGPLSVFYIQWQADKMNLVSNVNWHKISFPFSTLLRVVAAPHHKGFLALASLASLNVLRFWRIF